MNALNLQRFDTLGFVEKSKELGVSEELAKFQARELESVFDANKKTFEKEIKTLATNVQKLEAEIQVITNDHVSQHILEKELNNVATKSDIEDLRKESKNFATKADIEDLRKESQNFATKTDIEILRTETAKLKFEMIKWMLGIGAASVGTIMGTLRLMLVH